MPEDVGGRPFPDGEDHGEPNEEFASVVFDEEFVRAARYREPSARERLLAAARARAAEEAARARVGGPDDGAREGYRPARHVAAFGPYSGHYRIRGGHTRWQRTVAWLLALLMGLGVVALTFAAVSRGAAGARPSAPTPPPATGLVGVTRSPARAGTPSPH